MKSLVGGPLLVGGLGPGPPGPPLNPALSQLLLLDVRSNAFILFKLLNFICFRPKSSTV